MSSLEDEMRKSKEEAARTRERIVEAAAAQFRQNGIGETGLNDLMAAAGLTHGGFYRHFDSKAKVVVEALASAVEAEAKWIAGPPSKGDKDEDLKTLATSYLSKAHLEDRSGGCPFAGLGSELVRLDSDSRMVVTEGLMKVIDLIALKFRGRSPDAARLEALVAFSTMVGALTLSRMMTDAKLSNRLLRQAAAHIAGQE